MLGSENPDQYEQARSKGHIVGRTGLTDELQPL
jgi:hypothetical protein